MPTPLLARPDRLPGPGQAVTWHGLAGCGPALALAEIAGASRRPLLVLAGTVIQAEALEGELRFFLGAAHDGLALFPDL